MAPCDIPVFVNSFNQPTYLRGMVAQLRRLKFNHIVVIDQASTYPPLLSYLNELESSITVIRLSRNQGPHWFFTSGFCLTLPQFYIYTDADIQFGRDMPSSVGFDLRQIASSLRATKVGLALDISTPSSMRIANINIQGRDYNTVSWEEQFWLSRVSYADFPVYEAPVDTTFALYNREFFDETAKRIASHKIFDCMNTPSSYRVGGNYTAIHLPWMKNDPMPSDELAFYISSRKNIHDY